MFWIENKEDVPHRLIISNSTGGTMHLALEPKQKAGPIPDIWRGYFQQNAVEWAVIYPGESEPKPEPVTIRSIGKPTVEKLPAVEAKAKPKQEPKHEQKPRQYKKRSK